MQPLVLVHTSVVLIKTEVSINFNYTSICSLTFVAGRIAILCWLGQNMLTKLSLPLPLIFGFLFWFRLLSFVKMSGKHSNIVTFNRSQVCFFRGEDQTDHFSVGVYGLNSPSRVLQCSITSISDNCEFFVCLTVRLPEFFFIIRYAIFDVETYVS